MARDCVYLFFTIMKKQSYIISSPHRHITSWAIFQVQAPAGLYLDGRFNKGSFALPDWAGGLYMEGLIHGGAYFRNFTGSFKLH